MDNDSYIQKIEAILKELEEQGELVIASTTPHFVSQYIYHTVVKDILSSKDKSDFIIECDIPYLLEQTTLHLQSDFSESSENAKNIVNEFYHRLLKRLSIQQVAELIHHETPFEFALLSYYCVTFDKGNSRDFEYIEWRKKYYNQRK